MIEIAKSIKEFKGGLSYDEFADHLLKNGVIVRRSGQSVGGDGKMTSKEAIEIIKIAIAEVEWDYPMDYAIAFEQAIEALEKQTPEKPTTTHYSSVCPNCGRFVRRHEQSHGNIDIPHCKWCGQAIDWK